jgi:gluconokinase
VRHHEYMPASLLQSQFDDLEERDDDEAGITVDIAQTPNEIVEGITAFLTQTVGAREN